MKKQVLALFQNQTPFEQAAEELKQRGLLTEQIHSFDQINDLKDSFQIANIEANVDDRFCDMKSHLYQSLREWGIPIEDAFLYTECVRRGAKLLVVFCDEDRVDEIIGVLNWHGGLGLEPRRRYAKEIRESLKDGLKASPFTNIPKDYTSDFETWLSDHPDELSDSADIFDFTAQADWERILRPQRPEARRQH